MAVQLPKTQTYTWKGLDKQAQPVSGEISSTSITLAKAELRRQGFISIQIKKKSQSLFPKMQPIKPSDIAIFSRQLATLIAASIPLVQAFEIISKGSNHPRLRTLLSQIKADIEAGSTFASALAKHPSHFNELYCNLIHAGEQSGSLDHMLNRVATYREKIESLKAKIKKALFYPLIVIIVAIAVTVGLLVFVIPQFEMLFKNFGADLPALTLGVLKFSRFFQAYWWLMLSILVLAAWLIFLSWRRFPAFRHSLEHALLHIPVIGTVLQKVAIARFARTLATTFAAGLPLVEALRLVAGATGNSSYREASLRIRNTLSTGQPLRVAMQTTQLFPSMVLQMVAIGEESGSLEQMLNKIASLYEEDIDNTVNRVSTLIEPAIMLILGGLVGGLVIAMYLPIFKLGSVV